MPQIVRVTLFLFFASTVCVADEVPSRTMTWSLRDEFWTGAMRENPNSDRDGQPVWHFLRTTRSEKPVESRKWLRDGRYVPLAEKGDRVFGLPFDGWIFRLNPAESPVVSSALEDKAAGLSVHRGDIVIAPGPEHAVIVGWESPVAGLLEIQGSFEHVQSSGGIAWYVERGPQPNADADRGIEPVPLASGQSVFGTESQKGSFTVEGQKVAAGEFVYFIVDARADGTPAPHSGDGTRLDVTITVRDPVVPPPPSFEKDVLPLLAQKCHDCHGGDLQEGRLDLRTLAAILRGGENGPAAVPGRPAHSLILERVLAGEMPPDKNARLSPEQVQLLQRWIARGLRPESASATVAAPLFTEAEREHWAFRPLRPVPCAPDSFHGQGGSGE